ncbi:DNA primase [Tissierella creatinophila]|uniref:DNA primase n=1 Tax=Tissierella creatinophila DSM 6911 TaxID=1123403 RepID=A0A1U7M7S3_TISCR|nr:DNA primase [Tissierella creatinophila]OLS03362.1 DNA primase [Tissierella creatinophila DSM 6911]
MGKVLKIIVGEYQGDDIKMYINEDLIDQIKERADIVDIISSYLTLNRSGSNLVGLCPFHNEKTPSFTVSSSKQFFHCFGCGESGDSITFIMKKENLDFKEAVEFLADKLGIELDGKEVDTKEIEEKRRLYEINRQAGRYFHELLLKNNTSLDYLKRRGMELSEIKRFGIGFAPDEWGNLYKFLKSKGYVSGEIEKIGLINKKKGNNGYYDRFRNRIMFPIIDRNNQIIGFGGRVIDETMPKYLNSKESLIFNKGNNLYGLNLVKKYSNKKNILLVEGYMDVIALFAKGINYAVASLGTALSPNQAKLLKRYGEEIYIAYDSDLAGTKATLRAIDIMSIEGVKPKIVQLPKGMDPDDYIQNKGKIRFERLLKEALSPIDYKIILNKEKFNINNFEEKILFTKEISKVIKDLKSPIEEDVYIEKISQETGITKEAIEKEVRGNYYNNFNNKKENTKIEKPNRENINSRIQSAHIKAEIDLIKLMIIDKEYFYIIRDKILEESFSNLACRKIYNIIKTKYENTDILSIDDLIKEALNIGVNENIIKELKKDSLEYKPTNIEKVIDDLTNTLILNNLEEKRKKTIKAIKELEEDAQKMELDRVHFKELCIELTNLNKEIKSIRYE